MKKLVLPMLVAITLVSCTKEEVTPAAATIASVDFLVSGSTAGSHDLFSIENKSRVALADSTTTKWDFAIRFEKFIFNSNASGPGNAGVIIVNNTFESVTSAPETGYAYDTTSTRLAVRGDQWYTYNSATRTFAPTAGRTFVIRTATNKYAKLEMLSATPTDDNGNLVVAPTRPTKIKYAIRLAYQNNGRVF
jgi:hypothetical protein